MLDIDYSGCCDFWDYENERGLSVAESVVEGYFKSVKEAREYLELLEGDDEDF